MPGVTIPKEIKDECEALMFVVNEKSFSEYVRKALSHYNESLLSGFDGSRTFIYNMILDAKRNK